MAELACETVMSVNDLTVDHDTRSHTCTEGDHDEILHASCSAVCHFTDSSRIRVICKSYRKATQSLRKKLRERNHISAAPCKVHGILDCSCIIVTVRRAYSDTLYLAFCARILDDLLYRISELCDIRLDLAVCICADDCLRKHCTSCVHHTKLGGLASHVDTDYIC